VLIPMSRWLANHPVKLCLDHRVALARDCLEGLAVDDGDVPPFVSDETGALQYAGGY
jgi:hypothetical protein